jgi:lysosomal acid lipase/cholesteryl ester hydrolase
MGSVNFTISELDICTEDGWELKAYHHTHLSSKNAPVLLFHSLSLSAYSLNGGGGIPSIASWLSKNGYDTWVCECRGVGKAFHQKAKMSREWSFDDQLKFDVPEFIKSVQNATGHEKFHWIGHSMGGHLLLAYLCTTIDAPIISGVLAGSGFEISGSIGKSELTLKILDTLRIKRLPLRLISRLCIPFVQWLPEYPISKKLIGLRVVKEIMNDIHNVPTTLIKYALHAFRKGGIRSLDEKEIYSEKAKFIKTPLLFLSPNKDIAWTPSVISENLKFFTNDNAKMIAFGKEYGNATDYGHVEILMGKNAEKEVYPEILKWLNSIEANI